MFLSANTYLLRQLIIRNIQMRFRGSIFGWLWSFLMPLCMLGVFTLVFGNFFKARWGVGLGENKMVFATALLSGLTLYNIFSESLSIAATCIIANVNYVKKVRFPLELLVLGQVVSSALLALPWLFLLFGSCLIFFHQASFSWLLLPFVIVPFILFTAGLAFLTASLGVFFRDIQHIVNALLQMFFFLSPVFYRLESLPERYQKLLQFNPLVWFIEVFRKLFFMGILPGYNALPLFQEWLFVWLFGISSFALGGFWFMKTKRGFSDVL